MKKIKVCFLTSTLNTNCGWGRYSYELINRVLTDKNIHGIILTEECTGKILQENCALKNHSFNNFLSFLRNCFIVRNYIKKCDIVHCFDVYPYAILASLANIGLRRKVIINLIGHYSIIPTEKSFKKNIKKKLFVYSLKNADKIFSISHYTLNKLREKINISTNCEVMLYGVDSKKFTPLVNKNFKKPFKQIITVGMVKFRKGYHIALLALAKVKNRYPNFKYYIVGSQKDKGYVNYLKQIIRKYRLQRNVIFLENISDKKLISLYQTSDLFLMPTVNVKNAFEGFGSVYLEANACGIPVIGSYDCGTEDAIKNGYNGFLVHQNNVNELTERILEILDNPSLAKRMGKNGRIFAEKMSWDKIAKKFISSYYSLIDR